MIPLVKVLATPFHGKPRASGDDPFGLGQDPHGPQ